MELYNIHQCICSKKALLCICRNQISLKGDSSIILNVSLSICTEGSSPMLLSAPVFFGRKEPLWGLCCVAFLACQDTTMASERFSYENCPVSIIHVWCKASGCEDICLLRLLRGTRSVQLRGTPDRATDQLVPFVWLE